MYVADYPTMYVVVRTIRYLDVVTRVWQNWTLQTKVSTQTIELNFLSTLQKQGRKKFNLISCTVDNTTTKPIRVRMCACIEWRSS